jgi:hypothetical protein
LFLDKQQCARLGLHYCNALEFADFYLVDQPGAFLRDDSQRPPMLKLKHALMTHLLRVHKMTMSSPMLTLQQILLTHLLGFLAIIFYKFNWEHKVRKRTYNFTLKVSRFVFSHFSFTIEVKDGSKQN